MQYRRRVIAGEFTSVTKPVHVLLVEENDTVSRRVHELLRSQPEHQFLFPKFHLHRARSPRQLHRLLEVMNPEVVLLGISGGGDLDRNDFRRLQNDTNDCALVILADVIDEEVATQLVRLEASDILKPSRMTGDALHRSLLFSIEKQNLKSTLRRRVTVADVVTEISSRFINAATEDIDCELMRALRKIGKFERVDRAYLFELSPDETALSNTFEWCADGIVPQKDCVQRVPVEHFPWWMEQISNCEVVSIRDVNSLGEEAANERREFLKQDIRSIIAVPMRRAGRLHGFIGFDSVRSERAWSPETIALLRITAQFFASALQRKAMERKLRMSREQLRQSEESLRLTIIGAPIGMSACDENGNFLLVNEALCNLLQYTEDEFLETNVIDLTHPDDREATISKRDKLWNNELRQYELEKRYIRKDGQPVEILVRVSVIRDSEGRPLRTVSQVEDLSAKKQREQEIMKASKLESLGLLAGGIAHDFNNILTAISGSVSVAKEEAAETSPQLYGRLRDVGKACTRAKDLTQQLLTFAKGGAPIKSTASIANIVRDSATFILHGGTCRCQFDIEPELWPAEVDEGQICQVINNLVINAVQAMPKGGTIRIQCKNRIVSEDEAEQSSLQLRAGNFVEIVVRDSGCGIDEECLEKIFDPYFTTKKKGSGLGLATTYSIIKRHLGIIFAESTPGAGTTFRIYLPAAPRKVRVPKRPVAKLKKRRGRILVMDDEDIVRETTGSMLSFMGFEVAYAPDGQEAVKLYRKAQAGGRPFDLVIMDLTIPGGLGGEFAIKKLRRLDPDVKAIVSSGYSDDPIMANYERFGFRGVVAKPYEIDALGQVLEEVLDSDAVH